MSVYCWKINYQCIKPVGCLLTHVRLLHLPQSVLNCEQSSWGHDQTRYSDLFCTPFIGYHSCNSECYSTTLQDCLWQGVMPGGMPEANLSQSPDLKTMPSVKPDSTHHTSHDSKISCKHCHGDYGAPAEEFLPQKSR